MTHVIAPRVGLGCERLEPRQTLAANEVLRWNEVALATIRADRTPPPAASRALAITHVAIFDSVNAIDRKFVPYQIALVASPQTSREAAVASAAHRALVSLFPDRAAALDTAIARFWSNGAGTATPPGHLNTLAAIAAARRHLGISESARLFAMLNVAMADAAIMAWNAKYTTDFWRPVTAIRAADTDGNPRTIAEATWTPLLITPPFPAYVSGHASFSGAAAAVLRASFRSDRFRFTLPSEDPSIAPRSYTSFSQAARESADSRLYGGIHWRSDNQDGLAAGRKIGNFVFATLFRPLALKLRSTAVSSRPP